MDNITTEEIDKKMNDVLTGDKTVEEALSLEPNTPAEETPVVEEGKEHENSSEAKDEEIKSEKSDSSEVKTEGQEEKTPVVKAKDDIHTLPFSVVEGLRKQVYELESKLKQSEIKNISQVELDDIPEISADDLDVIKDGMPELAETVEKLMSERKAMAEKVSELTGKMLVAEDLVKATEQQETQGVIDSIPKLAHIQANNQELWDEAVKLDTMLAGRKENASMSLQDRFEKALKGVEALFGEISVPGEKNKEVIKELEAKPKEEKKEVSPTIDAPNSLSDLPAGSMHDHNPLSSLGNKSPMDIVENFNGKTPEQIESLLNQLI